MVINEDVITEVMDTGVSGYGLSELGDSACSTNDAQILPSSLEDSSQSVLSPEPFPSYPATKLQTKARKPPSHRSSPLAKSKSSGASHNMLPVASHVPPRRSLSSDALLKN